MAFGTPITIIKGGISAVNIEISYLNKPIKPKAHITPILTTTIVIKVALKDLKKKKKIKAVIPSAKPKNCTISLLIFIEFMVRI